MIRPNRIHAALREGRKAHGFRLTIPSSATLEILGTLDFDFVLIDDEHGVFGNTDLDDLCRTADLMGITPIARVPDCQPATINRRLDRGIRGIVAPHVSTREDAELVVRASYFAPLGERSLGGARGVHYQLGIADMPAYYRETNANMFVAVMIEDVEGMNNIEAICSVKGIHTVLVGINDFAQSLGHPGDASHPEVRAAFQQVSERVRKAGLPMREDCWVLGNLPDILVAGARKFARSGAG
ncbi:MAG: HpcH/HpaI aldolase/citrate lyase family protein [Lautropia sp.]